MSLLIDLHACDAGFGVIVKDGGGCRCSSSCRCPAEVAGKITGKLSAAEGWGEILLLGELSKQLGVHVFDS